MSGSTDSSDEHARLPKERIDAYVDPLRHFLHIESASGVVLLAAAAAALILANSALSGWFLAIWKAPLGFTLGSFSISHPVKHWINDGLMAVFFFVVGLEVKREFVMGELRDMRQAALPIAAALGGMVVPAGVYLALQYGEPGMRGWGIPMATDIAFVVGCMAVLGRRIPPSLRVLMLSLAIADDIGAILVIAIGYTESLNLTALALAGAGIGLILFLMHVGLRNLGVYLLLMVLVWFGFHESGIHATLAGVIFGLMTPARAWISEGRLGKMVQKTSGFLGGESWESPEHRYSVLSQLSVVAVSLKNPLQRFETGLHPWVGFLIMPVFALANAGVTVETSYFTSPVAVAVMLGLLVGKPRAPQQRHSHPEETDGHGHVQGGPGPYLGSQEAPHPELQPDGEEEEVDAQVCDVIQRLARFHAEGLQDEAGRQKPDEGREAHLTGHKSEDEGDGYPEGIHVSGSRLCRRVSGARGRGGPLPPPHSAATPQGFPPLPRPEGLPRARGSR
jgi:NhaA family Na+:H+ antiporter